MLIFLLIYNFIIHRYFIKVGYTQPLILLIFSVEVSGWGVEPNLEGVCLPRLPLDTPVPLAWPSQFILFLLFQLSSSSQESGPSIDTSLPNQGPVNLQSSGTHQSMSSFSKIKHLYAQLFFLFLIYIISLNFLIIFWLFPLTLDFHFYVSLFICTVFSLV